MRRPRHKLQVSTFPFLAVLLCAMGSLLLFLFIMDRRAKIAAQHMSDEVLEARKKRTRDEEDKLQAEWEQAKEKLHQALLMQHGELNTQAKGLQIDLSDADGKLKLLQTHYLELKGQAKSEAARIAEIQLQIAGRRRGLLDAGKKETMSKKELIAAAAELAELEIAFQQLVSMKEREKQVRSLVPYHGKHGDSRKPIYIECIGPGVIFHPDDRAMLGHDLNPGDLREEVERRGGGGKLTLRKLEDDKQPTKAKTGAYVLFLVRPSGISSYYRAQSALKGYRIDFGYELIDQDWDLDFGGKTYVKNLPIALLPKRTDMPIDNRPTFERPSPFLVSNQGSGSAGTGPGRGPGSGGGGPGESGSGQGPGFGVPPGSNLPPLNKGVAFGPGGGGSGQGPGFGIPPGSNLPPLDKGVGFGPGNGGPPMSGIPSGPGPIALPSPGILGPGPGPTAPPAPGLSQARSGNVPNFGPGPGGRPAFVPINKIQPPVPIASTEGSGNAGSSQSGGSVNNPSNGPTLGDPSSAKGPSTLGGNPAGGTGQYAGGASQNAGPGQNGGGPGQNGGGGPGQNPGGPGQNGSGGPGQNPNGPGQNPGAGTSDQKPLPVDPFALPNTNAIGGTSASNQGGSPGGVTSPALGVFGDKGPKRPAPSPLSRMLGNKDFLIYIDCYDDHVNVFPGGMSFRWNAANMTPTDVAFAQAVAKLIERRQASVRPGEPPYRPLICFRVDPDGRHCYLHVYPLLESLRVPMTRENIEEK